jgi:hypothetical protein
MSENEFEPKIPPTNQELEHVAGDLEKELMAKEAADHIDAAETAFSAEKAENEEKIAELKQSIISTANELPVEQQHSEKEGTSFTAPAASSKKAGFWKKATVFGGMAIGLFAGKNADAQQKDASDKGWSNKFKTEAPLQKKVQTVAERAAYEMEHHKALTLQEMGHWGEYVTHVKGLGLDHDARMNNRAFANKVLHDYIAEYNSTHSTPTTLNEEQVLRIQVEFKKLREWTLAKIKNHEKISGHYVEFDDGVTEQNFMASLSNPDIIAGPETVRYFGADYQQMLSEETTHLNNVGSDEKHASGVDLEYTSLAKKDGHRTAGNFISMNENQ